MFTANDNLIFLAASCISDTNVGPLVCTPLH